MKIFHQMHLVDDKQMIFLSAHVENGKEVGWGRKGRKRQVAYASRVYSLAAINT